MSRSSAAAISTAREIVAINWQRVRRVSMQDHRHDQSMMYRPAVERNAAATRDDFAPAQRLPPLPAGLRQVQEVASVASTRWPGRRQAGWQLAQAGQGDGQAQGRAANQFAAWPLLCLDAHSPPPPAQKAPALHHRSRRDEAALP